MTPDVSIVVPALNEADAIQSLLAALARQQDIRIEVVVADGGSRDATLDRVQRIAASTGLLCATINATRGRARQMNRGAGMARSDDLLFLHADSSLEDGGTLAAARQQLTLARTGAGGDRVAGHFGVRFRRRSRGDSLPYYFYEAKSWLNRRDCVNGDQGFWLSRRYFEEIGGFDESLPYLEDARLAERVFQTGRWVTLPGWLTTSARRFEAEGLRERQTLNAFLRNFERIGFWEFLEQAPAAYRDQAGTEALRLAPFFRLAHRLAAARGCGPFLSLWARTGAYVAENAWQLAFAADCVHNLRRGMPPGMGSSAWLERYDTYLASLMARRPAGLGAALLTAAWFYACIAVARR